LATVEAVQREQIIGFLRDAERGVAVQDLCRRHGFSEASYNPWRSKFGGMDVSDAKHLKVLESEKARLKKLLAESMLETRSAVRPFQNSGNRTGSSKAGSFYDDQGPIGAPACSW
jgi:putative transposase